MRDEYYRNRKASGSDTFFAFVTGIALGAIAVFMSSTDNREKVKEKLDDVKQKGQKLLNDTTQKAEEVTNNVSDHVRKLADGMDEKAKEAERATARRQNK